MGVIISTLCVLLFFLLFVYDNLEVTPMKYAVLRAMATQSREVDRSLHDFLRTKDDFKIMNKEYKRFQKIYLANLNVYILKFGEADNRMLRKEILSMKNIEL